jgi:ribosome-associated protein
MYNQDRSGMPKRKSAQTIPVSPVGYKDKTEHIVAWLEEKQGQDIVAIDVSKICTVADVMVVVTAQNRRHAQTLADFVLAKAGEEKFEYLSMEGYANAVWVLLDLNDVLVHVFQEGERRLYDIEGLWSEGTFLDSPGYVESRE